MRHDTIIADCAIGGKATSWMPRKGEVLFTQRLPAFIRALCPRTLQHTRANVGESASYAEGPVSGAFLSSGGRI